MQRGGTLVASLVGMNSDVVQERGTPAPSLVGHWKVRRVSGILPPRGIEKRIGASSGWTLIGKLPVARFRVEGLCFRYQWLPIRDVLTQGEDGDWLGRGKLFGWEFCRFRLERVE